MLPFHRVRLNFGGDPRGANMGWGPYTAPRGWRGYQGGRVGLVIGGPAQGVGHGLGNPSGAQAEGSDQGGNKGTDDGTDATASTDTDTDDGTDEGGILGRIAAFFGKIGTNLGTDAADVAEAIFGPHDQWGNPGYMADPTADDKYGYRISEEEKAKVAREQEIAGWTDQEYIDNMFTDPAQLLTIGQLERQGYSAAEIRGYLEGGLDLSYSGIINT